MTDQAHDSSERPLPPLSQLAESEQRSTGRGYPEDLMFDHESLEKLGKAAAEALDKYLEAYPGSLSDAHLGHYSMAGTERSQKH